MWGKATSMNRSEAYSFWSFRPNFITDFKKLYLKRARTRFNLILVFDRFPAKFRHGITDLGAPNSATSLARFRKKFCHGKNFLLFFSKILF